MNLPEILPIVDVALETVVSVVNRAKEQLGERQTLLQLAGLVELFHMSDSISISASEKKNWTSGEKKRRKKLTKCREQFGGKTLLNVTGLRAPLAFTAERLIDDAIRNHWRLTDTFMFALNYVNSSRDVTSHYYYYEAIFSQPTPVYPIPQATATVHFRVQDKYTHPPINAPVPEVVFRLEGHRQIHDIRFTTLVPEWLLAIIKMKIMLYKRIEQYNVF